MSTKPDPTAPPAETLARTWRGPTTPEDEQPLGAQVIPVVEPRLCIECDAEIPETQPEYVRRCGHCAALKYL